MLIIIWTIFFKIVRKLFEEVPIFGPFETQKNFGIMMGRKLCTYILTIWVPWQHYITAYIERMLECCQCLIQFMRYFWSAFKKTPCKTRICIIFFQRRFEIFFEYKSSWSNTQVKQTFNFNNGIIRYNTSKYTSVCI